MANLNGTVGALEIAVFLVNFLFGVVTVQSYNYYRRYPNDPPRLKVLVAVVWMWELAHTATVSYTVYVFSVTSFGKLGALEIIPTPLGVSVIFSGALSATIQSFFAHRVYILSKNICIPMCCWILSLLRFAGTLTVTVETFAPVTIDNYEVRWKWLLTSILIVGSCCDVLVSGSQWYYLRRERNLVFESTEHLLSTLMAYTIQTGLLTSAAAVTTLICFLTMPDNYGWLALFMFIAELYSNVLLANLNARKHLRTSPAHLSSPVSHQRASAYQNPGELRFASSFAVEIDNSTPNDRFQLDDLYLRQKNIELGNIMEISPETHSISTSL